MLEGASAGAVFLHDGRGEILVVQGHGVSDGIGFFFRNVLDVVICGYVAEVCRFLCRILIVAQLGEESVSRFVIARLKFVVGLLIFCLRRAGECTCRKR